MLPDLGEADVLGGPEAQFSLITRAVFSRSTPHVGCEGSSLVAELAAVGVLVAGLAPKPGWLPGAHVEAAGGWHWVPVQLALWPREDQGW